MKIYVLERKQWIPRPPSEVFSFFSQAENLEEITPPWLRFRIRDVSTADVGKGTLIQYALRWRFIPVRWTTEIIRWEPPHRFVDEQIQGPYRAWHHEHRFEKCGAGTTMYDTVRYALPLGPLGSLSHALIVRRDVKSIFDYRAACIQTRFGTG